MSELNEFQAQSSISQLLRAIGGWGGPGGPGLFMFRSLIIGSTTSAILGLTSASIASTFAGPAALAFVIGSSIGFIGGMIHYYRSCLAHVTLAVEQYPTLMKLHLMSNYPLKGWERLPVNKQMINSNWGTQSMAVAAYHSAKPAMEDLHTRREADIITELVEHGDKDTLYQELVDQSSL